MSTKTVITFAKFVELLEGALAVQFDGNAVVYPYIDHEADEDGNWIPTFVQIAFWMDGDEFEHNFYPDEITEIFVENGVITVVTPNENFTFRLLDTMPIVL